MTQEKPLGVLSARKMVRWTIFSEERAGRPWNRWDGVRHARKMIQWIIFSAERAGRPWLSVPVPGSRIHA